MSDWTWYIVGTVLSVLVLIGVLAWRHVRVEHHRRKMFRAIQQDWQKQVSVVELFRDTVYEQWNEPDRNFKGQ